MKIIVPFKILKSSDWINEVLQKKSQHMSNHCVLLSGHNSKNFAQEGGGPKKMNGIQVTMT